MTTEVEQVINALPPTLSTLRNLALYAYGTALTLLSLLPGQSVAINLWDKAQHFLAYCLLTLLVCSGRRTRWRPALVIVAYSGAIEWVQGFAPGREPSMADMLANSLGVIAAVLLLLAHQYRANGPAR